MMKTHIYTLNKLSKKRLSIIKSVLISGPQTIKFIHISKTMIKDQNI